ncbi:MAG: HAD-IIA family hydrolase [Armatimonadetes bacterium]|nr:HAD-IIA family hydrolase [Armatimonadota bacterium]
MRRYALYIFDLDGTLYRGSQALDGAVHTVNQLQDEGSRVAFLTNNSAPTRQAIQSRLNGMGFRAELDQCFGTASGTAQVMRSQGLEKAFVVGEEGLHQELRNAGIATTTESEVPCDALVCGICRSFTFDLLDKGLQVLLTGVPFIATNTDATYPLEGNRLMPGAGSLVSSFRTVAGREPQVIGKPQPEMVLQIAKQFEAPIQEVLAVGDRYETDIEAGRNAGCDTWMVLTGVTSEAPPGQPHGRTLSELLA